jgi:thiol-disulfide isomerase/thioredoxin
MRVGLVKRTRSSGKAVLPVLVMMAMTGCGAVNATTGLAGPTIARGDLEPGSTVLVREAKRPLLPRLQGTLLDGGTLDVTNLKGSVVVVNFWATWCVPCRAEARELNAVAMKTASSGVRFVGIDMKDDAVAAKAFLRIKAVPYPSISDQPGLLLLAMAGRAPQSPPTTLLIDRTGHLAGRFPGGITEDQLLPAVTALIAEHS